MLAPLNLLVQVATALKGHGFSRAALHSPKNCHPERKPTGRERRERLQEPEAEGYWFHFSATA